MSKKATSNVGAFLTNHKKSVIAYLIGFVVLIAAVVGPISVDALMTITAQKNLEILNKNNSVESAILQNDYQTWSNLTDDEVLKSQVNAKNFAQFSEAYRLLQTGRIEEANIIKKSISLKQDFGKAAVKSQSIDAAIKYNDYTLWRQIVGENAQQRVNASNFSEYAKAYRLIMEGKLRQAGYVKNRSSLVNKYITGSSR